MNLGSVLQVVGLLTLFVGVWMYSVPAALIVSGLAMTLVGVAVERSN
jgi:hypothetical protein